MGRPGGPRTAGHRTEALTPSASVPTVEPDLAALAAVLADDRFVGLQWPATSLLDPSA